MSICFVRGFAEDLGRALLRNTLIVHSTLTLGSSISQPFTWSYLFSLLSVEVGKSRAQSKQNGSRLVRNCLNGEWLGRAPLLPLNMGAMPLPESRKGGTGCDAHAREQEGGSNPPYVSALVEPMYCIALKNYSLKTERERWRKGLLI